MTEKKELLIGCGSNHTKKMAVDGTPTFDNLTTLDYNADHNPDVYWDLMSLHCRLKTMSLMKSMPIRC